MTCAPQNKKTPLISAAEKGHSTVIDTLVKAGADINMADKVCVFVSRWLRMPSRFFCAVEESASVSDKYSKYPPLLLYFP